jgi:hypothetical protein
VGTDLDKAAIEAEADRLSGVYLKVRLLAQSRQIDLVQAGHEAVANGLISAEDWELVRDALSEQ